MSYVKHHSIIVTGTSKEKIKEARQKAISLFEKHFDGVPFEVDYAKRLVSDIVPGITNSQLSFFIAPDGSKEGWTTSKNADKAREEFFEWLQSSGNGSYCIEICFGGDDDRASFKIN